MGIAAGVLVLAGIGVGVMLASSDSSTDETADSGKASDGSSSACPELDALKGQWVFTTVTTGARNKKRRGMRGYYEIEIEVDACKAEASLTKVGRTGAEELTDARKQRGTAPLERGEDAQAFGFAGSFDARSESGVGTPKRFVFALDGERLVGSWQQRGAQWKKSGQYGVLEGRREGDPRELRPRRRTMPCDLQCAVPETIELADAPFDPAALKACRAECR
ncbi:MAG: hypothetical protein AAF799_21535 [Myxococcota bacterium]